jgi:signal transduction histidine kinase
VSIRLRLTFIFIAIAFIPVLFVSALTFTNYKNSLEAARIENLQGIAAYKADKIETYFAGLKADIELAQGYYNIKKNLPVLYRLENDPKNLQFLAAKKILDDQLQRMQSVLGLSAIMLVDPKGRIVYSSNSERNTRDFLNPLPDPQQKAFEKGRKGVYFSDVFSSKADGNRFRMLVTAPAFDFNNFFTGVIAFEVEMSPIYKLIQETEGLGKTGETLIGKKTGNEILFLNPLRHDPNAALARRIPLGSELAGPVQKAVEGRNGAGRLVDYRGKPVIAAWHYVPSLDWGIVAKIDVEEAFSDVTNLRNLVMIILTIVFALCGIIAFSTARSISAPIEVLSKGAEIVGSGNLDHKIGSNRKDEIGQLSRTFDKMTRDLMLITASRNELNSEISERKRAEGVLQAQLRILAAANASALSADEVLQLALDEIEAQTKSTIGFYHFMEADNETLTLQNWSTNTVKNMCTAEGKGRHYPVAQAGVWTDCVHERRPIIHNDYASLPHRKGMPQGHAPVIREMVVPILRDGRIVAIIGVGNKPGDYDETDIANASLLGDISWEIVERKRVEEEIKRSAGELKRSNADLRQFAYSVSHDLQEPLSGMAMFLKLFEKRYRGKFDNKADELIDFMVDGMGRMKLLIRDLLAYSQVDTKGRTFELANFSVALEEAVFNLRAALEESGTELTYDLLPSAVADASQITRLFQNLIGNAIKYRGKEIPRIHVSFEKKGDEWVFSVRDNGIGIDAQYFEKIFDVFRRLHTRDEFEGTGIGLAICKKIVERHGGKIWVESEPGKGSTFYFSIPAMS